MKEFLKNKVTVFFMLGIFTLIVLLVVVGILSTGVSAPDKLMGVYVAIYALVPMALLLVIDRLCVWKFGTKKVNKVELYVLMILAVLFASNWIRLQLQI